MIFFLQIELHFSRQPLRQVIIVSTIQFQNLTSLSLSLSLSLSYSSCHPKTWTLISMWNSPVTILQALSGVLRRYELTQSGIYLKDTAFSIRKSMWYEVYLAFFYGLRLEQSSITYVLHCHFETYSSLLFGRSSSMLVKLTIRNRLLTYI